MSNFNLPDAFAAKKEKTKTYVFNGKTLDEHDDRVREKVMPTAVYVCNLMYSMAMLLAIRDELGFGTQRLAKLFNRVQKNFNAIVSGHLNYYDMAKQMRDECKINLVVERPDNVKIDADDIYRAVSGMPIWRIYPK